MAKLDETITKTVLVTRHDQPDWKIEKATSSSELIVTKIGEKVVDGSKVSYEIQSTFVGKSANLPASEKILISTNDEKEKQFFIPVSISVAPPIQAAAEKLDFGNDASSPVTKRLLIATTTRSQITKATIDNPAFEVVESEPGLKKIHVLKITYSPISAKPVNATLVVAAGDKPANQCSVQLFANRKSQAIDD